jgi:hypothetical protein
VLVGCALVDMLHGVVAHALILVAGLLRMALDGAQGALVGVSMWEGGLVESAQSSTANKGGMVCVTLDLLDLARGFLIGKGV